ncbi:MAG: FHA domain-containing protein [Myxococcales bacterium]
MTFKKPDDSGTPGQGPRARPSANDESTTVGEVQGADLATTMPIKQLDESDLDDSRPTARDLSRAPAKPGWSVSTLVEKSQADKDTAPRAPAPAADLPFEPDTSVMAQPAPARRPSQPGADPRDTSVSPPPAPAPRRASQTAVPAADAKSADTSVSPPPAAPARRASQLAVPIAEPDTSVSLAPAPPARRASQLAVPVAEPKVSDTSVSPAPVPPPRRASQLAVPAAATTEPPPPARRASQFSVPATDPSVERPTPVDLEADDTREVHAAPPSVGPRRSSQSAVPAAHASLEHPETRELQTQALPQSLENQETKETQLARSAPSALESQETRETALAKPAPAPAQRRSSKAELPATGPVLLSPPAASQDAPARPGTEVVPWKPSVPAPRAQAPASVIVHNSAVELQRVDPPARPVSPSVVLEVVSGHDIGRKVSMKGNRLTVGREAPCDLKLADAAVALIHLELVDGPDGLVLRDLSRGAGTRVNGKEVAKTLLRPGDRIGLGRSMLVVRRGAERASPARRALEATKPIFNALRPKRLPAITRSFLNQFPAGPWRKVAVGSMALALVLAAAAVVVSRRGAQEEGGPVAPRVGDSVLVLAEAEKLFDAKQYDAALRKGHDAQTLADGPDVRRFVERCREALQVKRQIDSAEAAAARGQYDLALAKGKATKASGTQGARLEGLMKTWATARDETIVQNVRLGAQDGDFATARALIVHCPAAMQGTLLHEVDELESAALGEKPRR